MKADEMANLTRAVIRKTQATVTFEGRPREIIVALRPANGLDPARLCFCLDGQQKEITLPVLHAYYAAVQAGGRQLIPRTLKSIVTARKELRYKQSAEDHAALYDLPIHTVRRMRKIGAPLDNPDAMGEELEAHFARRRHGRARKGVAA